MDKYTLSYRNPVSLTDFMIFYALSPSISISLSPGEESSMKAAICCHHRSFTDQNLKSWMEDFMNFNHFHPFSNVFQVIPAISTIFQLFSMEDFNGCQWLSMAFNESYAHPIPSNSHALLRWPSESAVRSCCAAMDHQHPKLPGAALASCISTLPGQFLS